MTIDSQAVRQRVRQALDAQPSRTVTVLSSLLAVQESLGYISSESIKEIAARTATSTNDVWGVASFYLNFRFSPPAQHTVEVCWGPTCHLLGAQPLLRAILDHLGLDGEGDTPDGVFALKLNTCLGACPHGPVVGLDHQLHGRASAAATIERLELLKAGLAGRA